MELQGKIRDSMVFFGTIASKLESTYKAISEAKEEEKSELIKQLEDIVDTTIKRIAELTVEIKGLVGKVSE